MRGDEHFFTILTSLVAHALQNFQLFNKQADRLAGPKENHHLKHTVLTIPGNFLSKVSSIWWVALFYLGAITLAEVLTALLDPVAGLILHGLVLLLLILQAAVSDRIPTRRFLLALSLAPLTRVLSLVMPLQHFPMVYWYLLVGLPLGIAAIFAARTGNLSRIELGLTLGKLPFQVLISLVGIGLGYLEYCILRPQPLIAMLRLDLVWLPALILLIFTGLLEEFIFRGLLQSTAISRLGRMGMVYAAGVFAVLHLGYRSWLDVFFVFGVALIFGWIVQRSKSIFGVTLAHGLTNISLFLVFPFLLAAPSSPSAGIAIEKPEASRVPEQWKLATTLLPDLSRLAPFQPRIVPAMPELTAKLIYATVTDSPIRVLAYWSALSPSKLYIAMKNYIFTAVPLTEREILTDDIPRLRRSKGF